MLFNVLSLFLPSFIVLTATVIALPLAGQLDQAFQTIITGTPYALAAIVALLGYVFNRSLIVFSSLNLIAAYALIQIGLQTSLSNPNAFVLFSFLSVMVPVHMGIISLYRERGLFTWLGSARLMLIALSYLALYLVWLEGNLALLLPDLPIGMLEMLVHDYFLSQTATWVFSASLLPILGALLLRRTYLDAALFTSWLCALIMLSGFDQPLISALFISASLIILAISVMQNSYRMAFIDELTAIPARRALQDKLSTLGKRYTLAMCDIDHFKQFNDTYGHDVGDQVLKMVAAKLAQVSGGGKAFRYGGEEFTLVFAGKTEQEAQPYIEQLRETIANYPMRIRNQNRPKDNSQGEKLRENSSESETVHVTISIGFCEKTPELTGPEKVIKQADQALYAAKKQGRNCSVASHWQPPKKAAQSRKRHDYA